MWLESDEKNALRWGAGTVLFLLAAVSVVGMWNMTCGAGYTAVREAQTVAQEEFGARGLLEKYRYFKRTAAALEAKAANIKLMQARAEQTVKTYGEDASRWPRDVREGATQDADALFVLKANFNQLAASYNASMADETKRFMNLGEWPKGWPASEREPLKREYAEYVIR